MWVDWWLTTSTHLLVGWQNLQDLVQLTPSLGTQRGQTSSSKRSATSNQSSSCHSLLLCKEWPSYKSLLMNQSKPTVTCIILLQKLVGALCKQHYLFCFHVNLYGAERVGVLVGGVTESTWQSCRHPQCICGPWAGRTGHTILWSRDQIMSKPWIVPSPEYAPPHGSYRTYMSCRCVCSCSATAD